MEPTQHKTTPVKRQLPPLPALKSLGKLSNMRPVIVVDSREKKPLPISRLPVVKGTLLTGDYGTLGVESLLTIERKSLDDLAGCCTGMNRARFERELCRLRGYSFARLLIIGDQRDLASGNYHSKIRPASVLATLAAFEVRYIPIVYAETPTIGARLVEKWCWWFCREQIQIANALLRAHKTHESASTKG